MTPPFTFTFDVEDHRPDDRTELRLLDATRQVLAFCAERGVVGTVFVVGEVVQDHPELVREIAEQGHELGLHGWSHTPITELNREAFREETARGRDLLAEVAGQDVIGFRAPTFSLVPQTVWATEALADLGFTYSSSILPGWNPLFGFPGLPRRPFTWPSGLLQAPCPDHQGRPTRPPGGRGHLSPGPALAPGAGRDAGPAPGPGALPLLPSL